MTPLDESKLDAVGRALLRMGVLAYGLTTDREWVGGQVDLDDAAGSARRAYVRIMLSFIEGMTHAFKDILLARHEQKNIQLSEAEVNVLRELQFELDGKCRARVSRRPLRIKDSVRFTLLLLARHADPPQEEPVFGDDGWSAFLEALTIRNRVTHPRSKEDLWVTENDLDRVDVAVRWFEDETARCFHAPMDRTISQEQRKKRL